MGTGGGGRAGTWERALSEPGLWKARGPSGEQAARPPASTARPACGERPGAPPPRPQAVTFRDTSPRTARGAPAPRAALALRNSGRRCVGPRPLRPEPPPSTARPEPARGMPGVRPRPEVRLPPAARRASLAAAGAGVSVGITPSAPAGQSRRPGGGGRGGLRPLLPAEG